MRTTRDKIRALLAEGLAPLEVTERLGLKDRYLPHRVRWCDQHPGYHAEYMRRLRTESPVYYRNELKQHRDYKRRQRASDA